MSERRFKHFVNPSIGYVVEDTVEQRVYSGDELANLLNDYDALRQEVYPLLHRVRSLSAAVEMSESALEQGIAALERAMPAINHTPHTGGSDD